MKSLYLIGSFIFLQPDQCLCVTESDNPASGPSFCPKMVAFIIHEMGGYNVGVITDHDCLCSYAVTSTQAHFVIPDGYKRWGYEL
jgi:hypothetical protein